MLEPYGLPGETPAAPAALPESDWSGPPGAAVPPAAGPSDAPRPAKKTGLVVLSVLVVLFFATAGVFGVLYSNEVGENDRLVGRLADKEKALSDSGEQLKDTRDELSRAKDSVEIAENARRRAEDDGAAMVKCRDAARALREAVFANDDPKGEKAFVDVFAHC
ncbi:hypothetical protein [Saccharothrix australiensis]|uniref:hypothetical protein n=1 Tax=Saccharothrix australiensis TaxID=2072 RepID=UPI0011C43F11|nr:hypothetical protein [Saccharothrix australiensis]